MAGGDAVSSPLSSVCASAAQVPASKSKDTNIQFVRFIGIVLACDRFGARGHLQTRYNLKWTFKTSCIFVNYLQVAGGPQNVCTRMNRCPN